MTNFVEDVRPPLKECFDRLTSRVARLNPGATWVSGQYRTDILSLKAYLAFSRTGAPGEEDIAIVLECSREGRRLLCTSDISSGEDAILLQEGPSAEIDMGNNQEMDDALVLPWLHECILFLDGSGGDLVCEELRAPNEPISNE
jgi:hypothetical protein